MRWLLIIVYICAGFAVVRVESSNDYNKSALFEGTNLIWSVVFWPVFPLTSIYKDWRDAS